MNGSAQRSTLFLCGVFGGLEGLGVGSPGFNTSFSIPFGKWSPKLVTMAETTGPRGGAWDFSPRWLVWLANGPLHRRQLLDSGL